MFLTDFFVHCGSDAVLGQLYQSGYSCKQPHRTLSDLHLPEESDSVRVSLPVSLWLRRWHCSWKSVLHTHSSSPPEIQALSRSSTSRHWHQARRGVVTQRQTINQWRPQLTQDWWGVFFNYFFLISIIITKPSSVKPLISTLCASQ